MFTLATPFVVRAPITDVTNFEVIFVQDNHRQTPPCLIVTVRLYSSAGIPWEVPQVLYLYDSIPSQILVANVNATSLSSQFAVTSKNLDVAAYSIVSSAYWAGAKTQDSGAVLVEGEPQIAAEGRATTIDIAAGVAQAITSKEPLAQSVINASVAVRDSAMLSVEPLLVDIGALPASFAG